MQCGTVVQVIVFCGQSVVKVMVFFFSFRYCLFVLDLQLVMFLPEFTKVSASDL